MKVALTGHIPSEYFQTHSSLSVDLMCTVPPTTPPPPTMAHSHESKVITISESNGSEAPF